MKLKPGQMLLALCIILVACRSNGDWSSTSIPTDETATVTMQAVSPTTTVVLPTTTLYPTLEPTLLGERLNEALNNPVCELPCWWGVIPGQTRAEEAVELFYRHAGISMEYFERDGYHGLQGNTGDAYLRQSGETCGSFELGLKNGVVKEVFIQICPELKGMGLSLEQVLRQYGQPERTRLGLMMIPNMDKKERIKNQAFYSFILVYDAMRVLIQYDGFAEALAGDEKFLVCPTSEQLWSVGITVLPKADVPMIYGLSSSYDVGELSGLENAKIYDLLLSAAGDGCFYATQYPRDKTP